MANIGLEVIRIALTDASIHQQEIDELISKLGANEEIVKLIHEQTKLIISTTELFSKVC